MKKICLYILIVFSFISCIEDYDLKIEDYAPEYTIDAVISNDANYQYVRISKVIAGFSSKDVLMAGREELPKDVGVEDAKVYIINSENYYVEFEITNDDSHHFKYGYGYYKAPDGFTISAGEQYHLLVIDSRGREYYATTTVKKTPEITDIVVKKQALEVQKESAYVPFISFTDLQADRTNYYITQLFTIDDIGGQEMINSSSRVWGYSIFDDSLLLPNVKDFKVNFGTASDHSSWYPEGNQKIKVVMMSVDKKTYDYYNIIISQIKNEGGMYSQTPASPITNINGGALGYFIASDLSSIVSKD